MSRFEVKLVRYSGLSRLEQKDQWSDGDYDSTLYLKIIRDGVTTEIHSDRMEPEDASFSRDLSWVKRAIQNAYDTGFSHGAANTAPITGQGISNFQVEFVAVPNVGQPIRVADVRGGGNTSTSE